MSDKKKRPMVLEYVPENDAFTAAELRAARAEPSEAVT